MHQQILAVFLLCSKFLLTHVLVGNTEFSRSKIKEENKEKYIRSEKDFAAYT